MINRAWVMMTFFIVTVGSGCGMVSGWIYGNPPRTAIKAISVTSDIQANQGTATMLDLVFVYDATAIPSLPKTGPEWFDKKIALKLMLAKSIDVVALQIPAGSVKLSVPLPSQGSKAIGVYAFANYVDEGGQSIANLTAWRDVNIRLMPKTIQYSGT